MSAGVAGVGPFDDVHAVVVDLHQRYALKIQRFCTHRLGSREEAEDATQQTFINAFRGLQRGATLEYESAWLFTIAEHVCQNSRRSSFRRSRVETPAALDEQLAQVASLSCNHEELIDLGDALSALPELQRRALLLREWQGRSYKEIADELGISHSAVETLLFRARRSLADKLTHPERRSMLELANVGSLLAAFKGLLFGGAANLAATVTSVAVVSIVAVGSGTLPAGVSDEVAPRTPPTLVRATGASLSPSNRITRGGSSAAPAVVMLDAAIASANPPTAVTQPSLVRITTLDDGSSAVTVSSAQPALLADPAGSAPPDALPPAAVAPATAGSVPATPPYAPPPAGAPQSTGETPILNFPVALSSTPDQVGPGGALPAAESAPPADPESGSASGATAAEPTSAAAPHDDGSTTPSTTAGGENDPRASAWADRRNPPRPPDGAAAKPDPPGRAGKTSAPGQTRVDGTQPPADPAAPGAAQRPQPPADPAAPGAAQRPQPPADPAAPGAAQRPQPPADPAAPVAAHSLPPAPVASGHAQPPADAPGRATTDKPQTAADPSVMASESAALAGAHDPARAGDAGANHGETRED